MRRLISIVENNLQFDITQSSAFRQWFGDSKVVDNHGNPLVVYHGTMFTFTEFSPGSHFGDITAANTRLDHITNSGEWSRFRNHQGMVIPVYLAIQQPLQIVDDGSEHDGYHLADIVKKLGKIENNAYQHVVATGSPGIAKRRLFHYLNDHGIDGMTYQNAIEGTGRSWLPFWSKQVKSIFSRSWSDSANIGESTTEK